MRPEWSKSIKRIRVKEKFMDLDPKVVYWADKYDGMYVVTQHDDVKQDMIPDIEEPWILIPVDIYSGSSTLVPSSDAVEVTTPFLIATLIEWNGLKAGEIREATLSLLNGFASYRVVREDGLEVDIPRKFAEFIGP